MNKHSFFKYILTFLLIMPAWIQAAPNYSNIYIFGDSLSDTGNFSSVVGNLPYPFYMNRISNGPVAVEILAEKLNLNADASLHFINPQQLPNESGTNYAVASAHALGAVPFPDPHLGAQLTSFHLNHLYGAPPNALYVIFIGGNDVRATRKTLDDDIAKEIIQDAADSVQFAIHSLTLSGAKHFLLVNSPNISLLPEFIIRSVLTGDPELLERTRKYSKLYRNKLHAIEDNLEEIHDINIKEFDLFTFFNKVVKKAEDNCFTN